MANDGNSDVTTGRHRLRREIANRVEFSRERLRTGPTLYTVHIAGAGLAICTVQMATALCTAYTGCSGVPMENTKCVQLGLANFNYLFRLRQLTRTKR